MSLNSAKNDWAYSNGTLVSGWELVPSIRSRLADLEFCDETKLLSNLVFPLSIHQSSGFGGLEVAFWPLVSKFAGSNPAEVIGFFRAKKNPQHPFHRKGSKAVCSMS